MHAKLNFCFRLNPFRGEVAILTGQQFQLIKICSLDFILELTLKRKLCDEGEYLT